MERRVMKMKKMLPLFMAAVLMGANLPLGAFADDETKKTSEPLQERNTGAEGVGTPDKEGADGEIETEEPEEESVLSDGEVQTDEAEDEADDEEAEDEDIKDEETKELKDEGDKDGKTQSGKVVTLGENLTESQKSSMYKYFGASEDEVKTIVVTHEDEVRHMEGIATAEQIGATTNSCAYVEPTESGGIKVKTANLNFVTSAMIASTLTTAGMENCNVIAACPFEVSGTGALTGIIMAYETASGESLDEDKKEAAMEELITTGALADTLGQEKAAELIGDIKKEVLVKGLKDVEDIRDAVNEIAKKNDAELTDEQMSQISDLMEKISEYDYDVKALKKTLDNLTGEDGALAKAWKSVKSFFVGSEDGILSGTNENALGGDIITDSNVSGGGFKDGLWTRIKKFFTGNKS